MAKKEKKKHPKKSTVPNTLFESESGTLKNNPDGETVCSPYFSQGCINEDTASPVIIKEEDKNDKH